MKRILITGGAGFVGASLAIEWKKACPEVEIISFDNLSRRGSELNLPRLKQNGVQFVHGDVRSLSDLEKIAPVDWLIECSAEPSVHAGWGGAPDYLVKTNLLGLYHCLEFLRTRGGKLVFLSSSRVYPIRALSEIALEKRGTRFALSLSTDTATQGLTAQGIQETFPLGGARSLYGATKLCGELLIQEYQAMYQVEAIVNRCGVLAGPWQMGKVDQGFMALWVAHHFFEKPLQYLGFGGAGLQVRDVLHVKDLFRLLQIQMAASAVHCGETYNVGGGMEHSVSLCELTALVQEIVQKKVHIGSVAETRQCDIPFYVTDNTRVTRQTAWRPQITVPTIVEEIYTWLHAQRESLKTIF